MPTSPSRRTATGLVAAAVVALLAAGCSAVAVPGSADSSPSESSTSTAASTLWDSSVVHDIALEVDEDALQSAIDAYVASEEKIWIEADAVIDGVRFERVGLKLKGNSSLRGITSDVDAASLPWIIRLDKDVDGQSWDGWTELVVRGNGSATSLNEAVALSLLAQTGLAAEAGVASGFSINGSAAQLRLIVQNPDQKWSDEALGDGILLYKSEATGSWDYVGDDPASYADSFDQEAGDDDLAPLVDFLRFVNDSDDATFAAELSSRLDVDAFATSLATTRRPGG